MLRVHGANSAVPCRRSPFSRGTLNWGGAAGTYWWVDPEEDLAVVFATQLMNRDDLVFSRRVSRPARFGVEDRTKRRSIL